MDISGTAAVSVESTAVLVAGEVPQACHDGFHRPPGYSITGDVQSSPVTRTHAHLQRRFLT
jgi:hypothetical protein